MNEFDGQNLPLAGTEHEKTEQLLIDTYLEILPETSGYLSGGGSEQNDVDPASTCKEEGRTYAYLIEHSRVRAALKRPLRFCKFSTEPACLMALEISLFGPEFRQIARLLRFKTVEIVLQFMDMENSSANTPEVVMFCPKRFEGPPTHIPHSYSRGIQASMLTQCGQIAGVKATINQQHDSQFIEQCNTEVRGGTLLQEDKPSGVFWQVRENSALRRGVPDEMKFAVAVNYKEGEAFKLKVSFKATLGFNDVQYQVKGKTGAMAVTIDPNALADQASKDEYGPQHAQFWHCRRDSLQVTMEDVKRKTNFKGSTVGCTVDDDEEESE